MNDRPLEALQQIEPAPEQRANVWRAINAVGDLLFAAAVGGWLAAAVIVVVSHTLASQRALEHKDPWSYHPDLLACMRVGGTSLLFSVLASLSSLSFRPSLRHLAALVFSLCAVLVYFAVHVGYIS